ncbi:SAC3/GANP/Nin1/mts3/eIF-3 p25 family-domain-containing protein [Blyttiomyces helicus]|uniref:SAC3/GANP/Nin1/mts3/eIF-3 p25 family-domain-containing protein n=1 Tax=Blyttiomyces helicus TaxID=388810 RepID=A0A4P9WPE7_9FUNG|nr:SAC3/GANP/Nin1/mts3/eIF-3 p25 family-domain-containing protein [Blyttiomyces helicus]|eukprot:RKO92676.1 SAC3/GANP/Nin1/mts3/eIF-3 p25 family-domain-containing protein [Blyttiomyces helicus]
MDPAKKYDLKDAVDIVGDCEDMCPEYERHEREYQNTLLTLEKIPGTEFVDHARAVKRYKRSAAGDEKPLPCDLRPPRVLQKTMDYLIHEIIAVHGVEDSHSFVRDRFRSIRNDLTLQNIRGEEAVKLHEPIARYHILCAHHLCDVSTVNAAQEVEQLRKTLLSLMEFYDELNAANIFMPNEAEFRAYHVLAHAYAHAVQIKFEKSLSPAVLHHPYMQIALQLRNYLYHGRRPDEGLRADGARSLHGRLFRLIAAPTTPYLLACCIHTHFVKIREAAFEAINASYCCGNQEKDEVHIGYRVYVRDLAEMLGFNDEDDCIIDLQYYGVEVRELPEGRIAKIGTRVGGKKTFPLESEYLHSWFVRRIANP